MLGANARLPCLLTEHFFHLVQLLSRDLSAYVIALDLYNNTIRVFDTIRDCATTKCPSIPVADFEGKTTRHHMEVTFGARGSIDCEHAPCDSRAGPR